MKSISNTTPAVCYNANACSHNTCQPLPNSISNTLAELFKETGLRLLARSQLMSNWRAASSGLRPCCAAALTACSYALYNNKGVPYCCTTASAMMLLQPVNAILLSTQYQCKLQAKLESHIHQNMPCTCDSGRRTSSLQCKTSSCLGQSSQQHATDQLGTCCSKNNG